MLKSFIVIAATIYPLSTHAECNMNYSTGSEQADQALAEEIQSAMRGSPFGHVRLASFMCGNLCLTITPEMDEGIKRIKLKRLEQIDALQIKPDYVKSYAHFILSDNMKANYSVSRQRLAEHMSEEEVEKAKALAKEWRDQADACKQSQKKGK